MSFIRLTNSVFEANYPERLKLTAIYPVPWVVKAMVDTMLAFSHALGDDYSGAWADDSTTILRPYR